MKKLNVIKYSSGLLIGHLTGWAGETLEERSCYSCNAPNNIFAVFNYLKEYPRASGFNLQ